jgi:glyoxylase-like metal-dependent hydrolase (beta-lactamase superfamily II)
VDAAATLSEVALSPRLLVLTLGGDALETSWGTNCVALDAGEATLLVDPLVAPAHARLVERALAARGFPPVRHVLLTHHHTDHALGAGWFAARGAAVVAHRRGAADMAAQHPALVAERRRMPEVAALFADAEPHVPSILFDDRRLLRIGGVEVDARHLGPGHTPGDAVVLFPSEGAVAAGDLVFHRYHFNYEEADVAALASRLEALLALPATTFIPGHGSPGGREIVLEQARYHVEVARLARGAPSAEAAMDAIRSCFPDHALAMAIATAVAAHRR